MLDSKKMKLSKGMPVKMLRHKATKKPAKYFSSKKQVTTPQTHSRKHQVPPNLERLLTLINSLPSDLPRYEDMQALGVEILKRGITVQEGDPEWCSSVEGLDRPITVENWVVFMFIDIVKMLSPAVQQFIGPIYSSTWLTVHFQFLDDDDDVPASSTLAACLNRYDFLFKVRDALRAIADKWASESNPKEIIQIKGLPYKEAQTPLALRLNENGRIARHQSELLDWFYNNVLNDMEAARILRCPMCDKIYWAERIDQPTCSLPCNNRRRSRIQRGTYVETRPRFQEKKARRKKQHGS